MRMSIVFKGVSSSCLKGGSEVVEENEKYAYKKIIIKKEYLFRNVGSYTSIRLTNFFIST